MGLGLGLGFGLGLGLGFGFGFTCSSVWGIMICALRGTRSRRWLTCLGLGLGLGIGLGLGLGIGLGLGLGFKSPMVDREDEYARYVCHAQVVAMHDHLVSKVDGVGPQLLLLRTDAR